MKPQASFTKKDIIVVLGCIIFLLANIAAIGPGGRRRAKEAVCLSNLLKWGQIFQAFLADNDGYFWGGQNGTGWWWIVDLDSRYQSWKENGIWFCPTATKPMYNESGVLDPASNIFRAWGIFYDPRWHPDGISGSYGLNAHVLNTRNAAPSGTRYSSTVDNWRTPNVKGANRVPLFVDSLRFDLWPWPDDEPPPFADAPWAATNFMQRCCIDRHDGYVNCSFLDFSVRKVGLKELWTLKWHRTFDTCGPWTKCGGVQPGDWPEWMRDFKDY